MGRIHLDLGCRINWQAQVYEIIGYIVPETYQLANLSFGGRRIATRSELVEAWANGDLRFEPIQSEQTTRNDLWLLTYADFQALDEAQRDAAWGRYRELRGLLEFHGLTQTVTLSHSQIEMFCLATGREVGQAWTLARWLKRYIASGGDIRSLVARTDQRGGKGQSRLQDEVETIMQNIFSTCRDNPQYRTPDMVYAYIVQRIAEDNVYRSADEQLKVPSRATFYRRLKQAGELGILRRLPNRSQRQKVMQVDGGVSVSRLLERVEIDHTPLDLFVVDLEDRLPIGRPTLTLATDTYSKMPFGFDISFDPPSYLTVMRCLRHGILPKEDCQMIYGTVNPFMVYGLPEMVIVNRGQEFIGRDLVDALGMLGVIREVMPARTPWYKGQIERFFRTQNQGLLSTLPGYSFGSVIERMGYDPQRDACISLSALKQLVHIFLLDIYAQRWHEGIQAMPAQRWQNAWDGSFPPALYPDAEELKIILCASEERTLTRQGITWQTLNYNSAQLQHLKSSSLDGRIRFRYDPEDVGQIYVFDEHQGWLTIPCIQSAYAQGLSLYKHRMIRQQVLEQKQDVNVLALAQARIKLEKIVAEEYTLTRQTRKRQRGIRFLEGDHLSSSSAQVIAQTQDDLNLDSPKPLDTSGWFGDYQLPEGDDDVSHTS